jgi:hypothetical protein
MSCGPVKTVVRDGTSSIFQGRTAEVVLPDGRTGKGEALTRHGDDGAADIKAISRAIEDANSKPEKK